MIVSACGVGERAVDVGRGGDGGAGPSSMGILSEAPFIASFLLVMFVSSSPRSVLTGEQKKG